MELDKYVRQLLDQRRPESGVVKRPPPRVEVVQVEPPASSADSPEVHASEISSHGEEDHYRQIKNKLHAAVVEKLNSEELNRLSDDLRREKLRVILDKMLETDAFPLDLIQRRKVVGEVIDDMLGFGPLEPLFRDESIGDILINGTGSAFVEIGGVLREIPNPFHDVESIGEIARRIATKVGRTVNESNPMVDARLPDGSRVHIVFPPVALNGPFVSIRRFGSKPIRMANLLINKSLTVEMAVFLEAAVKARLNIIVSGGTGSGKTTLLNALSAYISNRERIITIEDAAELQLQQRHVLRMESRPNVNGKGAITIRELVLNTLRMRPDRIIVGECRGAEAMDMLQAMNTGHDGSMTTIHANTPRDALSRLETMVLLSGYELPLKSIRRQIASAINLVVQVERFSDGARRLTGVTEVVGMEQDTITTQDLFKFTHRGIDSIGKVLGQFESTGIASHFEAKLRAAGAVLPPDLFRQRVLLDV